MRNSCVVCLAVLPATRTSLPFFFVSFAFCTNSFFFFKLAQKTERQSEEEKKMHVFHRGINKTDGWHKIKAKQKKKNQPKTTTATNKKEDLAGRKTEKK